MAFIVNAKIDFAEILQPTLLKLKERIQQEMKEHADRIIVEEMAKFSVDLAKIVSFQDFRDQIVITLKKEMPK